MDEMVVIKIFYMENLFRPMSKPQEVEKRSLGRVADSKKTTLADFAGDASSQPRDFRTEDTGLFRYWQRIQ
jgi:hypothetical protein